LDLGKMTILIGEQATGKSTIAKVLAICRYIIIVPVSNHFSFFEDTLKTWEIDSYFNEDTYIYYENNDFIKEIADNKLKYTPVSDFYKNNTKNLAEMLFNSGTDLSNTDEKDNDFLNSIIKNANSSFEHSFFIPTERGLQSIFSLGKHTISLMNDILFEQLSKLSSISKSFKNEINIKPLNIKYKNVKGEGFVKKGNENYYHSLNISASGYQSLIPIVLSVKSFENKEQNFIIEEPELNLFPKAQKKLMEFFVENINKNGHSFLLPTHSPYFLSAINDLLMAYKKGKTHPKEVEEIIRKESWLNPDDLSVYQLKDGFAYDIFNKELNLIGENIIDEVSDEMNDEFDQLLDIR